MTSRWARKAVGGLLVGVLLCGITLVGYANWYYAARFICEAKYEEITPETVSPFHAGGLETRMDNRHDISTSVSMLNPRPTATLVRYRFAFHSYAADPVSCSEWHDQWIDPFETFTIPRKAIVEEFEGLQGIPTGWTGDRLEGFILIWSPTDFLQVAAAYIQRDDRFEANRAGIGSSLDIEYITPFED